MKRFRFLPHTSREALNFLLRDAIIADEILNDPHGDETGEDSRSPTGDDYNELFELVLRACNYAGINVPKEQELIKQAYRKTMRDRVKP